jgi:hypothetical protein
MTNEYSMVLFGGVDRFYNEMNEREMVWFNDLWLLDLRTFCWSPISPAPDSRVPSPRDGHVALAVPCKGRPSKMLISGGWIGQQTLSTNMRSMYQNADGGTNSIFSSGLHFLRQLEYAHFAHDIWQFDFSKCSLYEMIYIRNSLPFFFLQQTTFGVKWI